MKNFLLIPLLIAIYIILVAVIGVAFKLVAGIAFTITNLNIEHVDSGFIHYIILLISWVSPYFIFVKMKPYFKSKPTDNQSS